MSGSQKEFLSTPGQREIYLRDDAEQILGFNGIRKLFINPFSLPIAGLRSVSNGDRSTNETIPYEILPLQYRPLLLFDLDEVAWPHIWAVVQGVGEATGKTIDMEYYKQFGNTRRIPEWKDDQYTMEIHDQIVKGTHEKYYPYVNVAYLDAIKALRAVNHMGHDFFYATSRHPDTLSDTLRVIEWNGMPRNLDQKGSINPFQDVERKNGTVYCGDGMPMIVGRTHEPKLELLEYRKKLLQEMGWEGELLVIDDLQKPFEELLQKREIIGIALQGDVNAHRKPISGELRVQSWQEITDIISAAHTRAVANDPSPYRRFKTDGSAHNGRILEVDKKASGNGTFQLCDLDPDAYRWIEDESPESVQKQFSQLAHD